MLTRRRIFQLFVKTVAVAIALLVLALPHAGMQLTTKPAAQQLIGTWRLVSIGTMRPNGEVVTEWMGPNPSGILIYDRTGHVSVQLMHDPRTIWHASLAADPHAEADAASIEQKAAAFSGYYAYYGRYEVDEQQRVVKHHVEGSLWPSEVGFTYQRHFEIAGNRITLTTAPYKAKGEQRYNRLIFERIP